MDRVILTIHLNETEKKRVNARRNVPVQALIDEIRSWFDYPGGEYLLFRMGREEPMDCSMTLAQHGLEDGDELHFMEGSPEQMSHSQASIERGVQEPIHASDEAYLQEERRGQVFEIRWQPAIIGRLYQMNPSKNKLLAVDLSGIEGSDFVSRHHACVTERGGQYFIESLNPRNPTYVNDQRLEHNQGHILQPGDRIRVGKIVLVFNLRG
jgi:hypothetical protein